VRSPLSGGGGRRTGWQA